MASSIDCAELLELAHSSATQVAAVAAQLGIKEARSLSPNSPKMELAKDLVTLAGHLLRASFAFGSQIQGAAAKTTKFLEGLELLCTVSSRTFP